MTDSVYLADANVLIALAVADHLHHDAAHAWFESWSGSLATCPITQGALVRFLVREGMSGPEAGELVDTLGRADWHEFWPDDVPIDAAALSTVVGHRQVTDAYLVALASTREARVVTFDQGLAAVHGPTKVLLLST